MNSTASRPKCHAGGGPLERRVRPLVVPPLTPRRTHAPPWTLSLDGGQVDGMWLSATSEPCIDGLARAGLQRRLYLNCYRLFDERRLRQATCCWHYAAGRLGIPDGDEVPTKLASQWLPMLDAQNQLVALAVDRHAGRNNQLLLLH